MQRQQLVHQTSLKQSHTIALAIVIPAKNEAKNLKQTLPALLNALKRFHNPFRVIVVDDHSTDDTAQVAKNYTIQVYLGQGEGPGLLAI